MVGSGPWTLHSPPVQPPAPDSPLCGSSAMAKGLGSSPADVQGRGHLDDEMELVLTVPGSLL